MFWTIDGGLFSIKIFSQYSQFFHLYAIPSAILSMLQDQICGSGGKIQKCKSCSSSSEEANLIHPARSVQKGNFRNRGYKIYSNIQHYHYLSTDTEQYPRKEILLHLVLCGLTGRRARLTRSRVASCATTSDSSSSQLVDRKSVV